MKKNSIAFRGGSYSIVLTVVVLVILILVNVIAGVLPKSITKQDISSAQLYSVTSNTKAVLNQVDKPVVIYWIVQADKENEVLDNLLQKYESLCSNVSVVKKNPDTYPTFTKNYTDEDVANNSLIVECGDKYRYIPYSKIYLQEADYTKNQYVYSFDGEGLITSAILYCVSEDLPLAYVLTGHGESELPSEFADKIAKENIEEKELSLLTEDQVPEDCDVLIIYAPETDISEQEKDILADYVKNGGKLFVSAAMTTDSELPNLFSLLSDYGVTASNGIVVEEDQEHYAFQQPYLLIPDLKDHSITNPLTVAKYKVLVPIAEGLDIIGSDAGTATALLTTSNASFSKQAGYNLTSYDKEEGDSDGPFAVAVLVQPNDSEGEIIWVASSLFLTDQYNSYSSGANINFAMNAIAELVGETESVTIRAKSLDYNYLTISTSVASTMKTVMIFVLPLCFLAFGIFIIVMRRRRRYE